jgi:hypothetical protein
MNTTAERLKTELKELDFKQPGKIIDRDLDLLLTNMVEHIGTTDSELRDKLIYTSFFYLIKRNLLTYEQMTSLIETCLNENHLFLKIGTRDDDSIFTRAFSSLAVALVLGKDREARFLPNDLVIRAIERSLLYLQKEEDLRGYVEGKGWAHGIAHGADLLDEAVKHPLFELRLAKSCLDAIGACVLKETVYTDDEDGRLVCAIESLLGKGLDEKLLNEWVISLSGNLAELRDPNGFSIPFFKIKTNLSNFMKTLYFRLAFMNAGAETRKTIEEVLDKWHRNIYK